MDTSVGLSTIASLSLGVSMSMTGTGRTLIKTLGTAAAASALAPPPSAVDRRRSSFTQLFPPMTPGPFGLPVPGYDRLRRASFVELVRPEEECQRLGGRQRRRGSGGWSRAEDGQTVEAVNALLKTNAVVVDGHSDHCNNITSHDKSKDGRNNIENAVQRISQTNKIQRGMEILISIFNLILFLF